MRRVRQLLSKRAVRRNEGTVAVEGAELLDAALDAGLPVESVFVAPGGRDDPATSEVLSQSYDRGARIFDLRPGVIERVADTVTPQPVVAVVGYSPASLDAARETTMAMICVDVRDPGNLGTIIRTAESTGIGAVVCCEGTVDPTNPKCLRASAGSVFRVPVVAAGDPAEVLERTETWGFTTVGTAVRGGTDYTAFDWRARVALVVGNEASGLDAELSRRLDASVSIPMVGRADSLNVGVAAAVICFEALHQRRTAGEEGRRVGKDANHPGPTDRGSTMPAMETPQRKGGPPREVRR